MKYVFMVPAIVYVVFVTCRDIKHWVLNEPSKSAKSGQTGRSRFDGEGVLFLDKKKEVGPWVEWNKEIVSRKNAPLRFVATATGQFGITLVTDRGRNLALQGQRDKLTPNDVVLTSDSKETTFTGREVLPPGHYWFILQNQTNTTATFHLMCYCSR